MYVSMTEMLKKANQNNYAVMAINCFNLETARAVIKAAELENSPIIINVVQEHLLNHCDSELITPIVKKLANRTNIKVALNFDHGQDVLLLKKAIDDGFSSVMVDASRFGLEGNIAMTKEIVQYAHPKGVSVEGEIGCMGATEGANFTVNDMYTNPKEALRFVKETGIDALAISIGSSHGNYPNGMVPKFDFERLKTIKELTKMPLVLHGGSGSGEDNILKSVKYGINKINVGCDFMNANIAAIKARLKENPDINYYVLMHQVEQDSINLVRYYIKLSGSQNKN
ncbi:class II fructose-bisphosphate aldolase [Thermoanaerobacterium thermosaccharolyticum]|uniref:Ketose-bisphosphate aldolase n=1 Tax=Thermoanaerobacterium thermosaccharolyticum M0795 TaxID=698948 RepID=L0II98_THETR|nr:class II fructose-bisphosphate aldolase [Thermoanaerobacterium thermosaccharolyticum]AGB18568.1 ketose-bisphosphate aldolase [Thermoanaerobacterium thermosaccharolyticum M0795]